jgi:competence protein ComEA
MLNTASSDAVHYPFVALHLSIGVIAMIKKLITLSIALGFWFFTAFAAAVEVNSADQAALESVKGIGPAHAKAIIDEREKNGAFKNADDLAARVKGIGPKSVKNLESAGLTINGSSAPPTGKSASAKGGVEKGTGGKGTGTDGAAKREVGQTAPASAPAPKKPRKGRAAASAAGAS